MKFGAQFKRHKVRSWDAFYVDYDGLKQHLKELSLKKQGGADVSEQIEPWFNEAALSLERVNGFFQTQVDEVECRIDAAASELKEAQGTPGELQLKHHLQSVLRKLQATLEDLNHFIAANYTALYKIFKKYDKQMEQSILEESLKYVAEQPWHDEGRTKIEELQERLNEVCVSAGLSSDLLKFQDRWSKRAELWPIARLCFSLGVIFMALLVLAVLSGMEQQNEDYSIQAFSATIPVFRLFFMANMAVWCAGGCALVFERYKVNYLFLLDISPDLEVKAMSLLNFASVQTGIWIVLFFCFLADFKFGALLLTSRPTLAASSFYTRILIMSQVSVTCLYTTANYRSFVGRILFQVVMAPVVPVTFASNLMADFLTSCGRPLKDLAYALCYMRYWPSDELYQGRSLLCKAHHGTWAWYGLQVVLVIPICIRMAQCLRRIYDTKTRDPHLLNFGKYGTALVVSQLANAPLTWLGLTEEQAQGIRIAGYVAATVYAASWDLVCDFGITNPQRQCLYPRATYSVVASLNIVLRSTWMATFLPDCRQFVSESLFNSECFSFAIGALEMCRRALWIILRLEHEHTCNAGRYRSVCWVPPLDYRRKTRDMVPARKSSLSSPSVFRGLIESQKSVKIVKCNSHTGTPLSNTGSPCSETASLASELDQAPVLPTDDCNNLSVAEEGRAEQPKLSDVPLPVVKRRRSGELRHELRHSRTWSSPVMVPEVGSPVRQERLRSLTRHHSLTQTGMSLEDVCMHASSSDVQAMHQRVYQRMQTYSVPELQISGKRKRE